VEQPSVSAFCRRKEKLVYTGATPDSVNLPTPPPPEGLPIRLAGAVRNVSQLIQAEPVRVYEFTPDPQAPTMSLKLQPRFVGNVDEMAVHVQCAAAQPAWYRDQMSSHLHCYFCFPSMLSVVAHAHQAGYQVCMSHVPKNMRVIFTQNPQLCDPSVFTRRAQEVTTLLRAQDLAFDSNTRSSYNKIISRMWEECQNNLELFDARIRSSFVAFDA